MQLAGHLRGKAAREYSFLSSEEKQSFTTIVQVLQTCLDAGSCALAAKNLEMLYNGTKRVSLPQLERSFQIAYGHEHLSIEIRDAFWFSQIHARLKLTLMEIPAVSGSMSYRQLCIAAK